MKNAGIAGAVALVGIGLITVGLAEFTTDADAAFPETIEPRNPRVRCQAIPLLDSTLRPFSMACDTSWPKVQLVSADVLNEGSNQWIAMPRIDYGALTDLKILTTDGIVVPTVNLLELDWEQAGISTNQVIGAAWLDVDEDGRLDLVFSGEGRRSGSLGTGAWLRNIYDAPARLPADLDNDGDVDGADLGELFVQWTG